MNFYQLSVSYDRASPKISFLASWLPDMGFTPGSPVRVLPGSGGMSFVLCDKNRQANEKGKDFIKVTKKSSLIISGHYVHGSGLNIGDSLLAGYEYGFINVKKIPDHAKLIHSVADRQSGGPTLKIRMAGKWLTKLGFSPGSVVIAIPGPGSVTFKLHNGGHETYRALVKYARENKVKLFQAHKEGRTTCLEIGGRTLEKTGFCTEDAFMALCDYGAIHVSKLDFEQLGGR